MSKLIMITFKPICDDTFSEELIEDHIAANLIRLNKLTPEGFIKIQKSFNENVFLLTSASEKILKKIYRFQIYIIGQMSTPINICITTEDIAKRLYPLGIKILIHGSGIWKIIAPMCEPILNEWLSNLEIPLATKKLITPFFQNRLTSNPNDIDWEIWPESIEEKNSVSIDELMDAFVTLLAEKFAASGIQESKLIYDISCLRAFAMTLHPSAFLCQLFVKNKEIPNTYIGLCKLYIQAFAFTNAVNIVRPGSIHCLRTIGNNLPHDFLFAQETRSTRMHINSPFINLAPFFNKKSDEKLKLESTINPEEPQAILQAIVGTDLNLLTFDRSKPLDTSDFIRTLINFTFGGRCYQKGVVLEMVNAVVIEARQKQFSLSKLLFDRFSHWFTTHKKNPSVLIALAFNTCALLDFYDIDTEEIQSLWELLLTQVDSHKSSIPLLKRIQTQVRASIPFVDLYFLIQMSSHISQHHQSTSCCASTQTDGRPYIQISLKIPGKEEMFALFFPCNLLKAINHFDKLQSIPTSCMGIHQTIVGPQQMKFKFDHSSRKQHANNFGRAFFNSLFRACHLLQSQHPALWHLGFQLTLSQLAQKSDSNSIRNLWDHFFQLLECRWAPDRFIKCIIVEFHYTLQTNGIKLDIEMFNQLYEKIRSNSQKESYRLFIHFFLKLNIPLYAELALNLIKKLKVTTEDGSLYLELIKVCTEPTFLQDSASALITKINQDEFLSNELKFKFFLCVYSKQTIPSDPSFAETLFQWTLKIIRILPDNTFHKDSKKKMIAKLAFQMNKAACHRTEVPLDTFEWGRHLSRLDLFNAKKVKTLKHSPNQLELSQLELRNIDQCNVNLPINTADKEFELIEQKPLLKLSLVEPSKIPQETATIFSKKENSPDKQPIQVQDSPGSRLEKELVQDSSTSLLIENPVQNLSVALLTEIQENLLKKKDYKSLSIQCTDDMDYLAAQKWLIEEKKHSKFLNSDFYNRFFNLIDLLIKAGHGSAASLLITSLEIPPKYQDNILNTCQSFITHQQFDQLLSLIKKFEFLNCLGIAKNHEAWELKLSEWLELVKQMNEGCNEKNGLLAKKQDLLLQIIYIALDNFAADPKIWRFFVSSVSKYGSLKFIELIFNRILILKVSKISFSKEDHLDFWIILLKRLSEKGSGLLMHVPAWSIKMDKTSDLINANARIFTPLILKGVSKYLKKLPENKHDYVINKIQPLFSNPEDLIKSENFNPQLLFYQSKIFSRGDELSFKHRGISCLTSLIQSKQTPATLKSKAVKLANAYFMSLSKCKNSKSIKLLRNCTCALQFSQNLSIVDHYSILNYLNLINKNKIFNEEEYLDLVFSELFEIFSKPFDKNQPGIERKKKFIDQIILRLLNYPSLNSHSISRKENSSSPKLHKFFNWALSQPHLNSHMSPRTIKVINSKFANKNDKIVTLIQKVNRVLNGITMCLTLFAFYNFFNSCYSKFYGD